MSIHSASALPSALSWLPTWSVLQKLRTCLPVAVKPNGPVYCCGAPLSTRYCVRPTPERASAADRVTSTLSAYQPLPDGCATLAEVFGAARSIRMPDTVLVVVLPALSVHVADADRFEPSPVTVLGAGDPATPEPPSVQAHVTVTSSRLHPVVLGVPMSAGAVLSTFTPVTFAVALLPAASVAVPVAVWFAPSPSVCVPVQLSTPDSASPHS